MLRANVLATGLAGCRAELIDRVLDPGDPLPLTQFSITHPPRGAGILATLGISILEVVDEGVVLDQIPGHLPRRQRPGGELSADQIQYLVDGLQQVLGKRFPITGGSANKNAGQTFLYFQGKMYHGWPGAPLMRS